MQILVLVLVGIVVHGEVNLSLCLHADTLALLVEEIDPAEVLTVARGLGTDVVDMEVADGQIVDAQVGTLLAVDGVVQRTACIVAGHREFGVELHEHAYAAEVGTGDGVLCIQVYSAVAVDGVDELIVTTATACILGDCDGRVVGIGLYGECAAADAITCLIVGVGAIGCIVLNPAIVAVCGRSTGFATYGKHADATLLP